MGNDSHKHRRQLGHALVVWLAAVVFVGAPAAAADSRSSAETGKRLEEVVVTAERRTQSLQDVSIAATVLGAGDLVSKSVDDVADLQQVAPSITVNTVNRSTFVNIRGVGLAQTAPTSVPGVAFYIDGQLIPHEHFIRQSFYDFDAVEILRGPQGTLNGMNSTGGAIYIRTPEPDFQELFGYADFTIGNHERYRAVGAINLPVNDNVAVRIAANHEQMDSFTRNIGPSGTNPGDFNQNGARFNLAARSDNERLRLNVRGEYFDYESGNSPIKNRNDLVTSDPYTIEEDGVSFLDQDGYRISGELRYDITEAIQIRALSSWQDGKTRDQVDGDRTATAPPVPAGLPTSRANRAVYPGRVSYAGTGFETLINEINFLSSDDGPFQWVVGGFMLEEDVPVFVLRDNYSTMDFVSSSSTIETLGENTSYAVFGQVNYFFDPKWEVYLGARHNWDEQVYHRINFPGPPLAPDDMVGVQESEEWTGKAGVNFHTEEGNLYYMTVAKGYKAGGVNLSPGPNFEPETNIVYEAGFKLTRLDGRARINAAVFYSDYEAIQFSSSQGGLPIQQNAASAESYGGELELLGQFGNLRASVGLGYLQGEFADDVCLNNSFNPAGSPLCAPGDDLVPSGRRLPFAPSWTLNAGVEYEFALGDGYRLTPRFQVAHTTKQYSTPFPSRETLLDARTIADARLALNVNDHYQIEAYATNLFDDIHAAAQVHDSSSATGGTVYGAPRQYGLRAMLEF